MMQQAVHGLSFKSAFNNLQIQNFYEQQVLISEFQLQDRGETPNDPVYECVLQGLNLVAKQAALPLLDHLFTWRREALVRATRAGGEMMVLRKRVSQLSRPLISGQLKGVSLK